MLRTILGLSAVISRLFGFLAERWLLFSIAALVLSPIGPHLRWVYSYTGSYDRPVYLSCTYLGSRGLITPEVAPRCPLIAILDSRDWTH